MKYLMLGHRREQMLWDEPFLRPARRGVQANLDKIAEKPVEGAGPYEAFERMCFTLNANFRSAGDGGFDKDERAPLADLL